MVTLATKILRELYRDSAHLTPKGYEIWHDVMNPLLMEMMGQ